MVQCSGFETCKFVDSIQDKENDYASAGFITMYCKGSKQKNCVRAKLKKMFGASAVPPNMMPNGSPVLHTNRDGWSYESLHYNQLIRIAEADIITISRF